VGEQSRGAIGLTNMDLYVYFNELSSPESTIAEGPLLSWRGGIDEAISCVESINALQPDLFLVFISDAWHRLYAGKPLNVWVKTWLGIDRYRRLLPRIRSTAFQGNPDSQVYFSGRATEGISLARQFDTWTCSFPGENTAWDSHQLAALEISLDKAGAALEEACEIKNLSRGATFTHWFEEISDWGRTPSDSTLIGAVGAYDVHMYSAPLEHGPPHVHVVFRNDGRQYGKYSVDPFERMEGRPELDSRMRVWITEGKDGLLKSWERCMRGKHPYKLVENS
jgi:hypothetical protein